MINKIVINIYIITIDILNINIINIIKELEYTSNSYLLANSFESARDA